MDARQRADVLYDQDRFEEASALYERALHDGPSDPYLLGRYARSAAGGR